MLLRHYLLESSSLHAESDRTRRAHATESFFSCNLLLPLFDVSHRAIMVGEAVISAMSQAGR